MSQGNDSARAGARPRRLAPVVVLVVVVVLGVFGWATLRRPDPNGTVTGTTGAPSASLTASPTGSSSPSPATPSSSGADYFAALYFVGKGPAANPRVLYRELVPMSATADTAQAYTQDALDALLRGGSAGADPTYVQLWDRGTTATVTVADDVRIVLSTPGRSGLSAREQHLAVQQLVWTANAPTGRTTPVVLATASGAPVFPDIPSGTSVPPGDSVQELAPLWVDSPGRYLPVPASQPVVVHGQACTFEATVLWELRTGGAVVASGHTTATSGCPQRGEYAIALGLLHPGAYQVRVWEASMQDGSVHAEQVMPFVVR